MGVLGCILVERKLNGKIGDRLLWLCWNFSFRFLYERHATVHDSSLIGSCDRDEILFNWGFLNDPAGFLPTCERG